VFERLIYTAVLITSFVAILIPAATLIQNQFVIEIAATVSVICAPLVTVAVMSEIKLLPGAIAFVVMMTLAAFFELVTFSRIGLSWSNLAIPAALAGLSYFAIPLTAAVRHRIGGYRSASWMSAGSAPVEAPASSAKA